MRKCLTVMHAWCRIKMNASRDQPVTVLSLDGRGKCAVGARHNSSLAFGALGNLPGARAVDLTRSPTSFNCGCTICAEPQQWHAVVTRQDVSCSGGTLANSAHQVDRDRLSRSERWQWLTNVLATHWRHACIELCSLPERGTNQWCTLACTFSETVPSAQAPTTATTLRPGSCHELQNLVVVTGDPVKQDVLHPIVRDSARKIFFVFESCHHVIIP